MTREEAYQKIEEIFENADYVAGCPCVCEDSFENIVDEVYNDFESRICKNCKYFIKIKKRLLCSHPINYDYIITDENFGCNRFERKENESIK